MNDTVSVRVKSETHEHEGKLVKPGTVISGLSPRTAKHLASLGAVELVTDPAPASFSAPAAVPLPGGPK